MLTRSALAACACLPLAAEIVDPTPRVCGGIHVGTAGFEVVGAVEWELAGGIPQRLRPEILINDDSRPGIGFSYTFAVAGGLLPERQNLFIGPRVVLHNNEEEDIRGEIGIVAFYRFSILADEDSPHSIDAIGALGYLDEKDDWDPAFTLGAAYGYQF